MPAVSLPRAIPIAWLQLAAMLVPVTIISFVKVVDPDYWWHLRTGDLILESGIPRHDPYSWTSAGEPWVAHEWLSEALMAAVNAIFGYGGNVALFDLAGVGAIAFAYATGRALRASGRALVACAIPSSLTMLFYLTPRPLVLSWLLISMTLWLIARFGPEERPMLWLFVPLTAIWANLHLGVFFGFMLMGLWCGSRVLDHVRGSGPLPLSSVAILIVGVAAASLNPHGPELLLYPLRYLEDRESISFVGEWVSPFLRPAVIYIPYYVSLAVLAYCVAARPRGSFWVLVAVVFIVLSVMSSRNVPLFALVFVPIAGASLTGRAPVEGMLPLRRAAPVALALAAITAFGSVIAGGGWSGLGTPTEYSYPSGGVSHIRARHPGARVFNEYGWGGYLIYRAPDIPVFVDGRSDFYRSAILGDFIKMRRAEGDWRRLLDDYGIDVVLVPEDVPLARELRRSPGWREEFNGDFESVFARATPVGQPEREAPR